MSLSPGLRKFGLSLHVTASVGLLGAISASLTLAIAALTARDDRLVLGAYLGMDPIARWVILPLMFGSLLSGLIVLLLPMVLSIYKPRGLTRRGLRLQHRQTQSI